MNNFSYLLAIVIILEHPANNRKMALVMNQKAHWYVTCFTIHSGKRTKRPAAWNLASPRYSVICSLNGDCAKAAGASIPIAGPEIIKVITSPVAGKNGASL